MLENNTQIGMTCRDSGTVSYTIPELGGLKRVFQAREKKFVTWEEVRSLSYMPGGMNLIEGCFIIDNNEAIAALFGGDVEPEYFYTEDEIKNLLLNASLEEVEDFLDFAPIGGVEIMRDLAVKLEINDLSKRGAISKKVGMSIDNAIRCNQQVKAAEAAAGIESKDEGKPQRRVQKPEAPAAKRRYERAE